MTVSIATSIPSAASEVTPRSAMPHGTMWPNMARSVVTFSATPWSVRRRPGPVRRVRTPMAAILRASDRPRVQPHPGYSSSLVAPVRPRSASVSMTTCSSRCTCAGPCCGVVGHGDDRVGHQLARPVVGDVAAPVGALQHGTHQRRVDQHMLLVRVLSERVGVRVLQDEEVVVGRLGGQRVLQRVGLVVGDRPERPDAQHRRGLRAPRPSHGCRAAPRPWPGTATRRPRRRPGGPS